MVTMVPLEEVRDLLRNKRGMLQRLAKRCQACPSPLHHMIYEYMLAIEAGLKELGGKYEEEQKDT